MPEAMVVPAERERAGAEAPVAANWQPKSLPPHEAASMPAAQRSQANGVARRKRVLVVDDEPRMLHLTQILIGEAYPGVDVTGASTATQALSALQEHAFDVIVSDYRMPDMDGVELLSRATQVPPERRILLTALADPSVRARASRLGLFVEKSLGPQALLDAVGRALA